ncbi:hypothetical protein [Pseudopedobacter beijingensis]|uniref:Uncharacterized protein n=1 Tax=Pseudopedobacter beijingensis TaxID=1207056 RepID=A0ABW4IB72_9SPHI
MDMQTKSAENTSLTDTPSSVKKMDQYLPSIAEFSDLPHKYAATAEPLSNKGKFGWENEVEQVEFYYVRLGDDAVIWNQQVQIKQDQDITLKPTKQAQPAYIFTYFFEASIPLRINNDYIFDQRKLVFCNDLGQYRLFMPKGFEGHILQIVISEYFLKNYVAAHSLQHPIVAAIVNRQDPTPLIISGLPLYVHHALENIVDCLYTEKNVLIHKLPILQLTAHFVDIFFKEYLEQQARTHKLLLDEDF